MCVRQILTKLVAANMTESAESHITNDEGFCDIPVDGMQNGISFEDEAVATLSVEKWCEKAFCPLSRIRFQKHEVCENGKVKYGRRDWKCCHGIKQKSKAQAKRPCQKINYTGCQVK